MSQDTKGPRDKKSPKPRESTLAFKTEDPGAEGLAFPKGGRVGSLRDRLSNFAAIGSTDPGKLDFQVFIDHIDGVKAVSLCGIAFDVVLTRGRSIFLISDLSADTMKEALPQAPGKAFDRCSTITSLISPPLYLYRITSHELGALEALSEAPVASGQDNFDIPLNIPDLRMKLKGSHILFSAEGFDMHSFADSISDASGFCDRDGNTVIAIPGSDDFAYTIYLNADKIELTKNSQLICRFLNSGKVCALCREDVIF